MMKNWFLMMVCCFAVSCKPAYLLSSATTTYYGLPVFRGGVAYHSATPRSMTPAEADKRSKAWAKQMRHVLALEEQVPILKKSDLLFWGKLPARQVKADGKQIRFEQVSFLLTIDNRTDSTHIWVTNVELHKKHDWVPIEKINLSTYPQPWLTMWTTDIDAAMSELIVSIQETVRKKTS